MGGLNKRRAVITGTGAAEGYVTILAEVSMRSGMSLLVRGIFKLLSCVRITVVMGYTQPFALLVFIVNQKIFILEKLVFEIFVVFKFCTFQIQLLKIYVNVLHFNIFTLFKFIVHLACEFFPFFLVNSIVTVTVLNNFV